MIHYCRGRINEREWGNAGITLSRMCAKEWEDVCFGDPWHSVTEKQASWV